MRCDDATRDLPRYAEGAMSGWSRVMLRLHIAGCSSCRQRLAALRECGRSLAEALQTPVDAPDVSDSVMAAIGQSMPASRRRLDRRWVAVPVAIAGALVAILVAVQREPLPVKSYQPPRTRLARTPKETPASKRSPLARSTNAGSVQTEPQPRRHIAAVPKRRFRPMQTSCRHRPASAQEQQPEPVSTTSSKIVVVVTRPVQPVVSTVEVEATNPSANTVVYYNATIDDSGNEQSTYMAFTKGNSDKEGTEL